MRRLATASHCASRPGPDWGQAPPTCQESGAIAPKCKCHARTHWRSPPGRVGNARCSHRSAQPRRLPAQAGSPGLPLATALHANHRTQYADSTARKQMKKSAYSAHTTCRTQKQKPKDRCDLSAWRRPALSEPGAVLRASECANACWHQGAATPGCCISSSKANFLSVTLAWPITNSVTLFSSTAASASAMRFWSA